MLSAALMGLAGAGHCTAMCGSACAAINGRTSAASGASAGASSVAFQDGRLLAYSLAGAVAAASVGALSQWAQAVAVLRPLWTLLHVAAIGVGLWLIWNGRQPAWMDRSWRVRTAMTVPAAGAWIWQRLIGRPHSATAQMTWMVRLAGLMLVAASSWALGYTLFMRVAAWCLA